MTDNSICCGISAAITMGLWQHRLFGCFGNCRLCLITFLLPCYTGGKVAETVGQEALVHGLMWLFVPVGMIAHRVVIRPEIRASKDIDGMLVVDLFLSCFCPCCVLIQEARETGVLRCTKDGCTRMAGEPGAEAMERA